MPKITELKDIHKNKPIAILGSGKSLPEDLKIVSKLNPIYISANDKPLSLVPYPDYIYCGGNGLYQWAFKNIDPKRTVRLSIMKGYSDYEMNKEDIWYEANGAGALAMSIGCFLGGNPVLLLGMDCFRTTWFDDNKRKPVLESDLPLEIVLNLWKRALKDVKNIENVRVVGNSPLIEVFGKYEQVLT